MGGGGRRAMRAKGKKLDKRRNPMGLRASARSAGRPCGATGTPTHLAYAIPDAGKRLINGAVAVRAEIRLPRGPRWGFAWAQKKGPGSAKPGPGEASIRPNGLP